MLSSYSVACPHQACDWKGNLVPSHVQGGNDAVMASMQRAWFKCPRCRRDWEVRIKDDEVVVLPDLEKGG